MTTDIASSNPGEPPVHPSTTAGLAFAAAVRAWGPPGEGEAVESLRAMLRAEATADLDWIHPTWLLRALQDESPAVRAAVAAHGPPAVRRALLASGGVPAPDRAPHPEVLAWVSALWAERLVGGAVECADDPPAIVALTQRPLGHVPSFAFGLNSPTRFYFDLVHVQQNNIPDGGVPTVGLFGPGYPAIYGPWGPRGRVVVSSVPQPELLARVTEPSSGRAEIKSTTHAQGAANNQAQQSLFADVASLRILCTAF